MSWHRVIIKHSADAHLLAQGLMIPFVQHYKEAGAPEDVSVYMHRDDFGNRGPGDKRFYCVRVH